MINAEKRRRKTSDSNKTITQSESSSDKPAGRTIFTHFTSRLLSRRHKHKHRKDTTEDMSFGTSANIRQKKPEAIPQKVVLYESDNEGVMSLIRFLNDKLDKHDKNDTTGNQTVNDIWKNAVEEFTKTLTALLVQGHKDLLMADLVRNFEEGFDKQIERQIGTSTEKKESFPKPLYMNSFRQTLEEYIQERRTRPRVKSRPNKKDNEATGGHHFTAYRVIQPNTCPVCTQRLWVMDKVQICSICKTLLHKECVGDPRVPSCTGNGPNEQKLFNVHLERICKDGTNTPEFVTKILQYLELNGILKQGLYRVSGAKIEENRLKAELDGDPFCNRLNFDAYNVHCVASIFKSFLRQLPNPLLPYDVSNFVSFSKFILFLKFYILFEILHKLMNCSSIIRMFYVQWS